MIALLAEARAAQVICDPVGAVTLVEDARIDERRAPVTHPYLVPGLARAGGEPELAAALDAVCAPGGELSVERTDAWEDAGWSAYTLVVGRAHEEGCYLVHERVAVSVGVGPQGARYHLRGVLPAERTPLGDCEDVARWRSERTVDGTDGPVRLVLVEDHVGEDVKHTALVVRRATADGWFEQTLFDPAPRRTTDPAAAGPLVRLVRARDGTPWVVASADRVTSPCGAVGGQTVWRPDAQGWSPVTAREAATLLAREGLWRLAGDDGWVLVLAQDDEEDRDLVEPRMRRIQRRDPEPLLLLSSSDLPGLNPGYVLVAPAPWATEDEARAARERWGRVASTYVKQAWVAPDPCSP